MMKFQGEDLATVKPFELQVNNSGAWIPDGTRPAFLLTFQNGSKRVLKGEILSSIDKDSREIGLNSAQFIGSLHSQLTADLDVRAVSDEQMAELSKLQVSEVDYPQGPPAAAVQYIKDLVESGMFVFYTMTFVTGLKNLESQSGKHKDHIDLAKVGAIKLACKMLSDHQLLPQLGRVIAVDLFSGNADRFDKDGKIVNAGNILFRKNLDKTYSPVGVDFFEAQNANSKLYTALVDEFAWGGKILAEKHLIDAFASKAITSLNAAFATAIKPHPMPSNAILGGAQVKALAAGISSGANDLRNHLLQLRRGAGIPPGVVSRMDVLGWSNTAWVAAPSRNLQIHPTMMRGIGSSSTPQATPTASSSATPSSSGNGWVTGRKPPPFK